MNVLHAECSSDTVKTDENSTCPSAKRQWINQLISDMCNSTDAIASKNYEISLQSVKIISWSFKSRQCKNV